MRKSYPFKNKQATKVLLAITNGKTNTEKISKAIGVKRSTVYDVMEPYRKKGIIKKKPKGFEIDWEQFYQLFITKGVNDHYYELIEKALTGDKKSAKEIKKISVILRESEPVLKQFVIRYIKNIAKMCRGEEGKIEFTIQDAIEDFWTAIPFILKKYVSKQANYNRKNLIICLNRLQYIFINMSALATEALDKSFNAIS